MTVMSSQEFVQDVTRAERDTIHGPVYILNEGRPKHVLVSIKEYDELKGRRTGLFDVFVFLSIDEYERLTGRRTSLIDLLASPETADIDFEVPRFKDLPRVIDFD